jgi:hypothetical protein
MNGRRDQDGCKDWTNVLHRSLPQPLVYDWLRRVRPTHSPLVSYCLLPCDSDKADSHSRIDVITGCYQSIEHIYPGWHLPRVATQSLGAMTVSVALV